MATALVRKDGIDPYPSVLLRGAIFLSIIQSMNHYNFQAVVDEWLSETGIGTIDPEAWYPRQEWLNLLKKLEQHTNSTENQVSIGSKVIDNAVIPDEAAPDSVEDAINMLVMIYVNEQKNLPTGDQGYKVIKIDDQNYDIIDTNPYLLNVNYGYIWGILRRFLKVDFTLHYEFMNKTDPLMGGVRFRVKLK